MNPGRRRRRSVGMRSLTLAVPAGGIFAFSLYLLSQLAGPIPVAQRVAAYVNHDEFLKADRRHARYMHLHAEDVVAPAARDVGRAVSP